MEPQLSFKKQWKIIIFAALILMVMSGVREVRGLLLTPIAQKNGLDIETVSLILAIAQLVWGAAQPLCGILADKIGFTKVMLIGAVTLAMGHIIAVLFPSGWGLLIGIGILASVGGAAGGLSILMGATTPQLSVARRSFASGFMNAGSSFGQALFAPFVQVLLSNFGILGAMLGLSVAALCTIPVMFSLRAGGMPQMRREKERAPILPVMKNALKNKSYICLHLGFFTCGFHVAFTGAHLPGEITAVCGHTAAVSAMAIGFIGLFNIAGSLAAGALGARVRMKYILFWVYLARTIMIGIFLLLPKTEALFYMFSAAIGMSWMATVPPTTGLIGKMFDLRYLSTLFGLTLFTHQIGSFLGTYLGGVFMKSFGNYIFIWILDALLALFAAFINLPIKEEKVALPAKA